MAILNAGGVREALEAIEWSRDYKAALLDQIQDNSISHYPESVDGK
jgi:hypothetical protein